MWHELIWFQANNSLIITVSRAEISRFKSSLSIDKAMKHRIFSAICGTGLQICLIWPPFHWKSLMCEHLLGSTAYSIHWMKYMRCPSKILISFFHATKNTVAHLTGKCLYSRREYKEISHHFQDMWDKRKRNSSKECRLLMRSTTISNNYRYPRLKALEANNIPGNHKDAVLVVFSVHSHFE